MAGVGAIPLGTDLARGVPGDYDGSTPLPSDVHEKFASLIASGAKVARALVQAHPKGEDLARPEQSGHSLAVKEHIKRRVRFLREEKARIFASEEGIFEGFVDASERTMGATEMVDVKVSTTWLFTGNRTVLSQELAERVLLIVLDPQMENPGDRTNFKYDLNQHVANNVGTYLHSFLTLVQNWIAKGCPEWKGSALGGFERHCAIVGGILEAAGIHGFLENRSALRNTVNHTSPEDEMMDALIERHLGTPAGKDGTVFRIWGADAPPKHIGTGTDRQEHPIAKHRVLSIRAALEEESIPLHGCGYAQLEDGGVIYPDRAKSPLRQHISSMAGTVREWGADREEAKARQGRYVLEKVHTDRHSDLYKLKKLDLI
ncbi:MAG: hypothetical protein N4A61_16425 [Pelagimonas sp.]|jgi:hypothetical protein|nr:hypothetical protein [Pelagimonas sp.]